MEDFVTFGIAKKLKEKGFKEECLYHYIEDDLVDNIGSPITNNQLWFSHNRFDNIWYRDNYDAPTISQVLKWLREDKKIHINTDIRFDGYWFFDVWIIEENNVREAGFDNIDYPSYEEAALAGIKYVLDNLI